jgi:hypothetical protein
MRIALYRIKKLAGIGVALNCPIGNQYKDKKEMETQQGVYWDWGSAL